jgi:peptidoglycan-N-acetylglucosamine deacetylase
MRWHSNRTVGKLVDFSARNLAGAITRVVTQKPIVSLTFDDGPDPVYTPKVLDLLKNYDAHATFFMVGEGAECYPDIVKQVARDGHAIGNHSWNHLAFPTIPAVDRWKQIRQCQQALKPYGLPLFRPPYGLNNNRSNIGAFLQGYKVIGWSLDSNDWYETDPTLIVDNLANAITPGSIILLHDRIFERRGDINGPVLTQKTVYDREPMLYALAGLLERLNGKTQFVTIPVLLLNGRPLRETV